MVNNTPANSGDVRDRVRSLVQKDPLEEGMAIHPVFLPEESHRERSLVNYYPLGQKESNTAAVSQHTHTQCVGQKLHI